VIERDQTGIRLDAIETALNAARREPSGQRRRRMLAAVQRAARAVRTEQHECTTDHPHLRVVTGNKPISTSTSVKKSEHTHRHREIVVTGIAIAATAAATMGATLTLVSTTGRDLSDAQAGPITTVSTPATASPPASGQSSPPGSPPAPAPVPPSAAPAPRHDAQPIPHAAPKASTPPRTSLTGAEPDDYQRAAITPQPSRQPSTPAASPTATPRESPTPQASTTPARAQPLCLRVHLAALAAADICV
jgi:hypothetical protein